MARVDGKVSVMRWLRLRRLVDISLIAPHHSKNHSSSVELITWRNTTKNPNPHPHGRDVFDTPQRLSS